MNLRNGKYNDYTSSGGVVYANDAGVESDVSITVFFSVTGDGSIEVT